MIEPSSIPWRRGVVFVLALLLVLGTVPGLAAAETRSGGTVVVEEGETVDGLEAFGGTIVVLGTVEGDLAAFGGNVRVEGEVTGDVEAFAGNVWIAGSVDGDVEAAAGNVNVEPGAEIGGSLSAAAGNVVVAGTVGGDAELAGGTVTLAESATVEGNVAYAVEDAENFQDEGATVGGTISSTENIEAGPWEDPLVPWWIFGIYGFFANLLLGAILLLLFPRFSAGVAERVATDPLRTAGVGLLSLIVIPILLVVLAVTIIGIPLAIAGGLLFGFLLWVALVYGRFAVGAWLLSLADYANRWVALILGLIVLGILGAIPFIGWLVDLVVVLLGLGAVVAIGYVGYRDRR